MNQNNNDVNQHMYKKARVTKETRAVQKDRALYKMLMRVTKRVGVRKKCGC